MIKMSCSDEITNSTNVCTFIKTRKRYGEYLPRHRYVYAKVSITAQRQVRCTPVRLF